MCDPGLDCQALAITGQHDVDIRPAKRGQRETQTARCGKQGKALGFRNPAAGYW
jgi:hypothetical protein